MHKVMWQAGLVLSGLVMTWLLPATVRAAEPKEKGIADFPGLSAERDWPWWRGPTRNGIAAKSAIVPTKWNESTNIVWKTPVPGRGHASPTVVGDKIFLATADKAAMIHTVLAFDRNTGKPLWQTEISQGGFPARNHPKNTEATPTIASDGELVFATFYHHETVQATALDRNGKKVWQQTVGPFHPKRYEYGYAPSPILYQDTVIIAAEHDGESFIAALDRKTGKPVWKAPRPENITFSTPVVAHIAGQDQLLISGTDMIASYSPSSGKKLWSVPGTTAATCGTIVWDGNIIFASGGYPKSETLAIRVTANKGEVLWRNNQKCYEQSMLAHNGHLYAFTDNGIMICFEGQKGTERWRERLKGPVSSSPVLVAGHIYWTNEAGTTYVFKPNPQKFDLVSENQLGEEGFASPAVAGNQLFIRTASSTGGKRQEYLYCIGK